MEKTKVTNASWYGPVLAHFSWRKQYFLTQGQTESHHLKLHFHFICDLYLLLECTGIFQPGQVSFICAHGKKDKERASFHYPGDSEERWQDRGRYFFLKGTVVCMKTLIVTRTSMELQEKVVRKSLRLISIITKHFTPVKNSKHIQRCQSCSLDREDRTGVGGGGGDSASKAVSRQVSQL